MFCMIFDWLTFLYFFRLSSAKNLNEKLAMKKSCNTLKNCCNYECNLDITLYFNSFDLINSLFIKEVCNGGVACRRPLLQNSLLFIV